METKDLAAWNLEPLAMATTSRLGRHLLEVAMLQIFQKKKYFLEFQRVALNQILSIYSWHVNSSVLIIIKVIIPAKYLVTVTELQIAASILWTVVAKQ